MHKLKVSAGWLGAVVVGLGVASLAPPAQAQSADTQYFPLLVYRTGPYAANGAQLANGMIDYLKLVNANGGVNGVMLSWDECETEYQTDAGVECYERLKGNGAVAAVAPFSTSSPARRSASCTSIIPMAASRSRPCSRWLRTTGSSCCCIRCRPAR